MKPTVLQLADQLATAEAAFARAQERGARRPNSLIRAEPGCERQCVVCWLECSIIHACVEETRRLLEKAIGEQTPTLSHGGKFYVASVGRA